MFISLSTFQLIPSSIYFYSILKSSTKTNTPFTILALPTMEAFSFLKYWRGSAATSGSVSKSIQTTTTTSSSTSSSDNEGPYFDLEFSLPDETAETETETEDEEGEGGEINLSISSSSTSYDSSKEHLHSEETLFFSGENPTSLIVTSTDANSTPKFRNNLFKSAKFRVLMALKLKKLKENGGEEAKKAEMENNQNQSKKFFTVKFVKVEESPIVSLFSRDSSSKSETRKVEKGSINEKDEEEKRFTKDVMQKYLKPLYVRASKRYGEKLRFSGQLMSFSGGENKTNTLDADSPQFSTSPQQNLAAEEVKCGGEAAAESACISSRGNIGKSGGKSLKDRNLTAGLRVVRKHLGKSKSASAVTSEAVAQRRDDSLMQQQDGIQSAIMHCKRSFNSSRETSVLLRSSSHQLAAVAEAGSTTVAGQVE